MPRYACRVAGANDAPLTVIALHGSGADETAMLPLAAAIAPEARCLSLRGPVDQAGERRWFLKHTPTSFVQRSVVARSHAFAAYIDALYAGGLDPTRTVFLGYSNGGNLIHATLVLAPGRIRRAILFRCMPVLTRPPLVDLGGVRVLLVSGIHDATYGPSAGPLAALLRERGAEVDLAAIDAGHEIGADDVALARAWLAAA